MPQIRHAGPEAKARLVKQGRGYSEREPYRQAILAIEGDASVELIPDEGESMRRMKTLTAWAAKEVGRAVKYGETQEGTLLVWLADAPNGRRRRRGRQPNPADMAAQVQ